MEAIGMKFSQASESFRRANPDIFQKESPRPEDHLRSKDEVKTEKILQEQIVGFLERNNVVVIRSRMDRKTSTNVGTPDLLFSLNGKAIAFEVKLPGHKPTKEQTDMMQRMTRNGWLCEVVYTYDEAVQIYRNLSGLD
jgi:hypothetical protein